MAVIWGSVRRTGFPGKFHVYGSGTYVACFFPEVYPSVHGNSGEVGIRNWSFWLALEVCDYFERSGDRETVENWRSRMERFVEGVLALRGESGLLENLPSAFVDWSLSNSKEAKLYSVQLLLNQMNNNVQYLASHSELAAVQQSVHAILLCFPYLVSGIYQWKGI